MGGTRAGRDSRRRGTRRTDRRGRGAGAVPPQPPPPVDPNAIPNSTFGEVAGRGYPLPLQPWAAALKKERMADNYDPVVWLLNKFRGGKKKTPA